MPATEQPTETDLTEEFNSQAEMDQQDEINEAQERADSVADESTNASDLSQEFNDAAAGDMEDAGDDEGDDGDDGDDSDYDPPGPELNYD